MLTENVPKYLSLLFCWTAVLHFFLPVFILLKKSKMKAFLTDSQPGYVLSMFLKKGSYKKMECICIYLVLLWNKEVRCYNIT